MMRSRVGPAAAVMLVVVAVVGATLWARSVTERRPRVVSPCHATLGTVSYPLDLEQAANATTVAAVGKRLGFIDHAVTIALATALQESGLHNLASGDLDSLGLFQQRPSQGWGTPGEVMVPRYAAGAFYARLAALPDWQAMAVTDAAQSVQHSAAPDAYAQWEPEARLLAQVLTGEAAAGLSCRLAKPTGAVLAADLAQAMAQELGPPGTGVPVSVPRGWTVASWLVGHAHQYQIASVTFGPYRWGPGQGGWRPYAQVSSQVQVALAPRRGPSAPVQRSLYEHADRPGPGHPRSFPVL